ncbi:MAG: hypothetical protein AAF366_17575 [Pseudomonadota bacterium]
MTRTFTALATAAVIAVSGVSAVSAQTMGEGLNMLQAALVSDFNRLNIPVDTLNDLTLGQIVAIKNIVEAEDDDSQTKGQIEAIIANN